MQHVGARTVAKGGKVVVKLYLVSLFLRGTDVLEQTYFMLRCLNRRVSCVDRVLCGQVGGVGPFEGKHFSFPRRNLETHAERHAERFVWPRKVCLIV